MSTLSMYILKHPNFLKKEYAKRRAHIQTYFNANSRVPANELRFLDDLREDIIKSVKFLVPKDIMFFKQSRIDPPEPSDTSDTSELRKGRGFHVDGKPVYDTSTPAGVSESLYDKYIETWKLYGVNMPYPVMFLENETVGILLKKIDDTISLTVVYPKFGTSVQTTSINTLGFVQACLDKRDIPATSLLSSATMSYLEGLNHKRDNKQPLTDFEQSAIDERNLTVKDAKISAIIVMQILSFINARNVVKLTYIPSNKEFAGAPPCFRSRYTYNTIDIYKERNVYVSLEEMVKDVNTEKSQALNAHMVRGHFKHKKNGVFWWNSFVRNKKSMIKDSVTPKDYALKQVR